MESWPAMQTNFKTTLDGQIEVFSRNEFDAVVADRLSLAEQIRKFDSALIEAPAAK